HYLVVIHPTIPKQQLPLLIRTRHNGDKVELNGQKGHKKVSRFFIYNKNTKNLRIQNPII
ncbi:tRNA lysidine(34) synthetase TilS, partial [Staphylococcus sp. GDX7P459A]|uniref:tRNA lysidine(34) synthetase TilS n=1 Tax=Staphylococcus sp. GDX7P459A TaxID=2608390 RepID=UPI001CB7643D